jgi:two-component system cell cycle response regulator
VVFVVFPLLNLVAVALTVRLWFGLPAPTPALLLFALYLTSWVVGDGLLLVTLMRTGADLGIVDDPLRICAFVALAACAQHPSMVAPGVADAKAGARASSRRLLVLGLVTVVPPIVLVSQYVQGASTPVISIAAASVVLSVLAATRMNLLVREQHTLAITDALTGLRSRRFFDDALAANMDAFDRDSYDTGLLLVDVDHFKKVNDVHGHAAGDLVLREVSERLMAAVRSGDVVARYGGEEFAILLPRAAPDAVLMIAERMRQAIASAPFDLEDAEQLTVTVSIGAASMSEGAVSADHLTKSADERLYAAKAGGRNRVTTAA